MKVVFVELGVGYNMTYICLNYGQAYCPLEIENQSFCVDGDIWEILKKEN